MIELESLYLDLESMIQIRLRKLNETSDTNFGPLCEELCVFIVLRQLGLY